MKRYLTPILAMFGICVCSCHQESARSPLVTKSPACSPSDLIALSSDLRNLASNEPFLAKSLIAYLERNQGVRWKLYNDASSFDNACLTYTSNDWQGVEVQAMYFMKSGVASGDPHDGDVTELQVVVSDVSKPENRMIIKILHDGALCW